MDSIIGYLIFFGILYLLSVDDILVALFLGSLAGVIFMEVFNTTPFDIVGIRIKDSVIWTLVFFIILVYIFGKLKKNKKTKNNENESFYISDCPLEIVAFGSHNNIFTAGNNTIIFKVRNNSDNPILFNVELLVGDKWIPSKYNDFEIEPKSIKTFNILGPAWRKAKDIRISYCS